jgi:hypothetical protein
MNELKIWDFMEPVPADEYMIEKYGKNPEGWGYNLGEYLKGVLLSINENKADLSTVWREEDLLN